MSREDRRDSYRVKVDFGQAHLILPEEQEPVPIVDISASGAGLYVPPPQLKRLRGAEVHVQPGAYPGFSTRVVPVDTGDIRDFSDVVRVGLRFGQLDRPALASLAQFVNQRYAAETATPRPLLNRQRTIELSDARQINHVLSVYAISDQRLRVARDDVPVEFELRVAAIEEHGGEKVLVARVDSADDGVDSLEIDGKPYTFSFERANALHWFDGALAPTGEPGTYRLPVPSRLFKTGFRSSLRTRLPEQLIVSVMHPRLPHHHLQKVVLDVSGGGLSFPFDPATDLLFPGERVVIEVADGWMWAEAIIRSIGQRQDCPHLVAGLEFIRFSNQRNAERWRNLVFHASYPDLRLGERQTVSQAWEVLESSKYVGKETTDGLESHLKERFLSSWNRFAVKGRFGNFCVAYSEDKPVGTVAANLVYPGTWLIHHFGIDEQRRRASRRFLFQMAREIYNGILHLIQQFESFEHFLIYADADKRWNQMMYGRFLEQYPNKDEYIYDTCTVFKCLPEPIDDAALLAAEVPAEYDRVEAEQADAHGLATIAAQLRETLSPLELRAFCLERERIALRRFSEYCSERGYSRDRTVYLARLADQPLAAMVVESGDEGANIFNLLNRCWLVPLAPRHLAFDAAQQLLLRRAIDHYLARDAREVLFLARDNPPIAVLERLGFRLQADAVRFIGSRELIPAWMNDIHEFLSSVGARRS